MKNRLTFLHDQFCEASLLRNYRPSTIQWWRGALQLLQGYFRMGELRTVADLTVDRLQTYFIAKRAGGWTADTYSNQYRALHAFLRWCVARGELAVNPLVAIPRPKLERKLPKRITLEEAEIVLNYAFYGPATFPFKRYRNRALLAVMLYAGLRRTETVNLEVNHVDLTQRSLFVRCGKGGKDRLVPLSATLTRYLEEYLAERTKAGRRSKALFTLVREDRPLSSTALKRILDLIRKGTGIDVSAHRLRHTFATLMLEGGCDLFSLKEMMGHSRIETTMGYLSATLGHLRTQIAKHPLDAPARANGYGTSSSPYASWFESSSWAGRGSPG